MGARAGQQAQTRCVPCQGDRPRQFQKDLERLARTGERAVVSKLERVVYPQLREHPHFGPNIRKLRGFEPDTWRYRIGSWRFFYEIDEGERIVFLIAAAHRSSAN